MPSYDLEKIEEVGTKHVPALADWYYDTLELIDKVGRWRDNAFSDALEPLWNDCFVFTYEVVYETVINLEAFGPSLVEVVESVRGADLNSASEFETRLEDSVATSQEVVSPAGYTTFDDRLEERGNELKDAAGEGSGDPYEPGDEYENLTKEYSVYEINESDGTRRTGQQGRTY